MGLGSQLSRIKKIEAVIGETSVPSAADGWFVWDDFEAELRQRHPNGTAIQAYANAHGQSCMEARCELGGLDYKAEMARINAESDAWWGRFEFHWHGDTFPKVCYARVKRWGTL